MNDAHPKTTPARPLGLISLALTLTSLTLTLTFLTPAAAAPSLKLTGEAVQGGLIIARTDPGTVAWINGKHVRVSPDGLFLIGFHRDEQGPVHVRVAAPGSGRADTRRSLSVRKRIYDEQRIDGLPPSKVVPSAEDLKRIRRENALIGAARYVDEPRTAFQHGFIWPVEGRISGVYGSRRILNGNPRRPHYGVDIAAPTGTPVRAPAAGRVTLVHDDMFFSGGTMILDHGHGLSSTFLHLHRILVKKGQIVARGDVIAEVGASGRVTGAHLDWRINLFKRRLDPVIVAGPMPL